LQRGDENEGITIEKTNNWRRSKKVRKPPIRLQDFVYYAHTFLARSIEPFNVKEVLGSSNSKYWQEAMNNEYESLIKTTFAF
jgi:hypothetical protein